MSRWIAKSRYRVRLSSVINAIIYGCEENCEQFGILFNYTQNKIFARVL